jgi:6-phosphogluconolactonase
MSDAERTRQVVVKPTDEEASLFVAGLMRGIIAQAVADRGAAHVALAGGTTPRGLYQILARGAASDNVPWQNVEVLFSDERDVPQDDVDSNYGMAQRELLDHLPILVGRVHPMPADADDLHAAAQEYEQTIRKAVPPDEGGQTARFDLILLGMGGDGHVASLFPGSEALDEGERLVVSSFISVLGRQRMTFTFPLINAARNVIMLVTGPDKAEAVAKVLGEDEQAKGNLPAARVRPEAGELFIVLDAPAARRAGLAPD